MDSLGSSAAWLHVLLRVRDGFALLFRFLHQEEVAFPCYWSPGVCFGKTSWLGGAYAAGIRVHDIRRGI